MVVMGVSEGLGLKVYGLMPLLLSVSNRCWYRRAGEGEGEVGIGVVGVVLLLMLLLLLLLLLL